MVSQKKRNSSSRSTRASSVSYDIEEYARDKKSRPFANKTAKRENRTLLVTSPLNSLNIAVLYIKVHGTVYVLNGECVPVSSKFDHMFRYIYGNAGVINFFFVEPKHNIPLEIFPDDFSFDTTTIDDMTNHLFHIGEDTNQFEPFHDAGRLRLGKNQRNHKVINYYNSKYCKKKHQLGDEDDLKRKKNGVYLYTASNPTGINLLLDAGFRKYLETTGKKFSVKQMPDGKTYIYEFFNDALYKYLNEQLLINNIFVVDISCESTTSPKGTDPNEKIPYDIGIDNVELDNIKTPKTLLDLNQVGRKIKKEYDLLRKQKQELEKEIAEHPNPDSKKVETLKKQLTTITNDIAEKRTKIMEENTNVVRFQELNEEIIPKLQKEHDKLFQAYNVANDRYFRRHRICKTEEEKKKVEDEYKEAQSKLAEFNTKNQHLYTEQHQYRKKYPRNSNLTYFGREILMRRRSLMNKPHLTSSERHRLSVLNDNVNEIEREFYNVSKVKNPTIRNLKKYQSKAKINKQRWHIITGDKEIR